MAKKPVPLSDGEMFSLAIIFRLFIDWLGLTAAWVVVYLIGPLFQTVLPHYIWDPKYLSFVGLGILVLFVKRLLF